MVTIIYSVVIFPEIYSVSLALKSKQINLTCSFLHIHYSLNEITNYRSENYVSSTL